MTQITLLLGIVRRLSQELQGTPQDTNERRELKWKDCTEVIAKMWFQRIQMIWHTIPADAGSCDTNPGVHKIGTTEVTVAVRGT
eukprot:112633-Amphidinium_carterae.1